MEPDRDKRLRELIAKTAKDKPPAAMLPIRPWQNKPAPPPIFSPRTVEQLVAVGLAAVGYNMSIALKVGLWVLTGGLVLHLILFSEAFAQRFSEEKRWLAVVLLPLLVTSICGSAIHQKWISEHAVQTSGVLEPEDRYLSPNSDRDSAPILEGGDSDNAMRDQVPDGTMFKMNGDFVRLRKVDGKVLFSATVRDHNGNTVVQVADNHWYVAGDRQISWDHNYDDHSLEVLDSARKVILQVRLYRDGARLQGEWFRNNTITQPEKVDPTSGIIPLFKYPSDLYWSQRSGDYGY